MNIKKIILFPLLMLFPVISLAYNQIDSSLEQCLEDENVTSALAACYQQATARWQIKLNTHYQEWLIAAPIAAEKDLKESQAAWEKYRENYSISLQKFYTAQEGTIWSIIAAEAIMNITKDKVMDLKRVIDRTNLCGGEHC